MNFSTSKLVFISLTINANLFVSINCFTAGVFKSYTLSLIHPPTGMKLSLKIIAFPSLDIFLYKNIFAGFFL